MPGVERNPRRQRTTDRASEQRWEQIADEYLPCAVGILAAVPGN
jgi:hypothetical protein